MTLLTIAKDVADEVNVSRPSSVIGSDQEEARKILRYANKCGTHLMRKFPWQALRAEQTFTGVAGSEQASILPSDFDRFVPETFWDRTNKVLCVGPIGAVEWQSLKASDFSGLTRFTWRGDAVLMIPDLNGGEALAFEYISKNWCQSSSGTGQAAWAADDDVGVLDEELLTLGTVYEFLAGEDLPWEKAWNDYKAALDRLTDNEMANANIMSAGDIFGRGRHFSGAPGYIPTTGIL